MTGAVLSECGQKLNRVVKNWSAGGREEGGTAAARANGTGGEQHGRVLARVLLAGETDD